MQFSANSRTHMATKIERKKFYHCRLRVMCRQKRQLRQRGTVNHKSWHLICTTFLMVAFSFFIGSMAQWAHNFLPKVLAWLYDEKSQGIRGKHPSVPYTVVLRGNSRKNDTIRTQKLFRSGHQNYTALIQVWNSCSRRAAQKIEPRSKAVAAFKHKTFTGKTRQQVDFQAWFHILIRSKSFPMEIKELNSLTLAQNSQIFRWKNAKNVHREQACNNRFACKRVF